MWIRGFAPEDAAGCASVYYTAVQDGAAPHYTAAQRDAWAPKVPEPGPLAERLGSQSCFVADDGAIVGFMSLRNDGYVDMAFVAPQLRGSGVAQQLYAAVLNAARIAGMRHMTTQASYLARPFFERLGWQTLKQQEFELRGVMITNFAMSISFDD